MLHSDELLPYAGPLTPAVQKALLDIKQYFGVDDLKVLVYDTRHIVIPVNYSVSLPSNGAVNGIDIQASEPMLIQISLRNYPNLAPFILSDRKNFPRPQLSHLYFTEPGIPARLCLVRNSPNEWFANIKLVDFLEVGGQWLYKAATGQLNEDGDEFDPTRVEGNVWAKQIYKYDTLHEVVSKDQRLVNDYPMAVFTAGLFVNDAARAFYKTIKNVPFIVFETVIKAIQAISEKEKDEVHKENPMFSIVLWHPDQKVELPYITTLPSTFGQLKIFFSIRGIDITAILLLLEQKNALIKCGVPIIYAMKRPSKMIGYDGDYEFFNFVLTLPTTGVAMLTDDADVSIQSHVEPFSPELAAYVSGRKTTGSMLYVGAGSLGSKMIMHDARSGNLALGVVDDKRLLPHNLTRHELFAEQVGLNKAKAMIDVIKKFYTVDNTDKLQAYEKSVVLLGDELKEYRYLIDTTASVQVGNYITLSQLPEGLKYCKAEIADNGELGLFYAEGGSRNPRMDDLTNLACFLATQNPILAKWRQNDAGQTIDTLNIGLGCSSATVVMADDIISLHASIFSRVVTNLIKPSSANTKGLLYLNACQESDCIPQISGREYQVEPFEILNCGAGSGWQLRLMAGITQKLTSLCHKHKPVETGGVLVGIANYKTKVIHVFDILTEPQDSHGTCVGFTRGVKGLPEEIENIKKETGDVIGYIGEWHSHPMNLKRLSTRDEKTIAELKEMNKKVPIPTCAVIVTQDEVLAFVFE